MTGFKTVTFKGTRLTSNQLDMVQLNKNLRKLRNPDHLRVQVDSALAQLESYKASGHEPYKPWTVVQFEKGTPFLGDCFVH